ncbi:MAG: hypothetical protein WDM87_13405 [Terracidiphilus sp.]
MKTQKFWSALMLVTLAVALMAVSGCGKKKASTLPSSNETAPTENGGVPTAQLTATPNVISAGDQVQLRWATTNATSISIDGIGDVPSVGVKDRNPVGVDYLSSGGARRQPNGRRFSIRNSEFAAGD